MMTSKIEIGEWFDRGVAQGATHMLIICDTFDWDDYPVFTATPDDAAKRAKYPGEMQKLIEVYDLSADKERQLSAHRVMNLPHPKGSEDE